MKIVWTNYAINNLKEIYDFYWLNRSKKSAIKVKNSIFIATGQLINYPESGQIEENLKLGNNIYRYIISYNCKIIYRISSNEIIIIDVFDTRKNPDKMNDAIL
jgi:toxin ParE1/3/4